MASLMTVLWEVVETLMTVSATLSKDRRKRAQGSLGVGLVRRTWIRSKDTRTLVTEDYICWSWL